VKSTDFGVLLIAPAHSSHDYDTILIASPGGSGNGMLTCLEQLDRFCRHTGAVILDYIGNLHRAKTLSGLAKVPLWINRWNNDYKKKAVFEAAKAMASGRNNGDTI